MKVNFYLREVLYLRFVSNYLSSLGVAFGSYWEEWVQSLHHHELLIVLMNYRCRAIYDLVLY